MIQENHTSGMATTSSFHSLPHMMDGALPGISSQFGRKREREGNMDGVDVDNNVPSNITNNFNITVQYGSGSSSSSQSNAKMPRSNPHHHVNNSDNGMMTGATTPSITNSSSSTMITPVISWSSIPIASLNESQCIHLLFGYFVGCSKSDIQIMLDQEKEKQKLIGSNGVSKIQGHDLVMVETAEELKELGVSLGAPSSGEELGGIHAALRSLPTVKLRRILLDLKHWKESGNGCLPSQAHKFLTAIMSDVPPMRTPPLMQFSIPPQFQAQSSWPPKAPNQLNEQQVQQKLPQQLPQQVQQQSMRPMPTVVPPVLGNYPAVPGNNRSMNFSIPPHLQHGPQVRYLFSLTIRLYEHLSCSQSNKIPIHVPPGGNKIPSNQNSSIPHSSHPAGVNVPPQINEDVYLLIAQGKLQSVGINTQSLLQSESLNVHNISPVAIQYAANEVHQLDPWTTMMQILQRNPSYVRMMVLLCNAYISAHNKIQTILSEEQVNRFIRLWFQLLSFHCLRYHSCSTGRNEEQAEVCGSTLGDKDIRQHQLAITSSLKVLRYILYYATLSPVCQFPIDDMLPLVQCLNLFKKEPEVILLVAAVLKNYPTNAHTEAKLVECGVIRIYTEILSLHNKAALTSMAGSCLNLIKFLIPTMKQLTEVELNHWQFVEAGACQVLVDTLMEYRNNETVVKQISSVIWALSMSSAAVESKRAFFEAGVCDILAQVVQMYQFKPVALTAICGAIWSMTRYPDAKVRFGMSETRTEENGIATNVGVCECLVNILSIHQHQHLIVDQVCGAVGYLADYPSNHRKLVSLGACEAICNVLKVHQDKVEVAETACAAIWSLAENDPGNLLPQMMNAPAECTDSQAIDSPSQQEHHNAVMQQMTTPLTSSDICCELLVSVLRMLKAVPSVVRQVCGALFNVCKHNIINQKIVVMIGVRPLLFEALQNYGQDSSSGVVREILTLDHLLLAGIDTSDRTVATEKISLLLQIIHHHSTDIIVVTTICKLFVSLLKNSTNIALFDPSAISTMIVLLATHKSSESTVSAILSVLQRTGIHFNFHNSTRSCNSLLSLFEEVLMLYKQSSVAIINPICWLIASLGIPTLNQLDLTASKFCATFVELFALHLQSPETVLHISWVIANACSQKFAVAKKFAEEKLLNWILEATMLHIRNPTVMKYLCFVLKALTSYYHLVQNVLDTNVVYSFLELVLPIYPHDKNVMKALVGTLTNMMKFDAPTRNQITGSGKSQSSTGSSSTAWSSGRFKECRSRLKRILAESIDFFTGRQQQLLQAGHSAESHHEDHSKLIEELQLAAHMLAATSSSASNCNVM